MTLAQFNALTKEAAAEKLFSCCGSKAWVAKMMMHFPFASEMTLINTATAAWYNECTTEDWLEAFTHHPKIGDLKSLQEKFASTKKEAGEEQAGMTTADESTLQKFATANDDYEQNFG